MTFQVKIRGYVLWDISCTDGAIATFDEITWSFDISNITTTNTICRLDFITDTIHDLIISNLDNDSALENIFRKHGNIIAEDEEAMNEIVENSKFKNLIISNLDNDSALENIFRKYANIIVKDKEAMNEIVENSKLRNLLYDNAVIFEPLIANSEIALNAMKNSSRYASTNSGATNSNNTITLYNGKAFIFTCSSYSNRNYSIVLIAGNFINGNKTITGRGSSGQTLTMTLNKFGDSVTGNRYSGWDAQTINMTYFKI